MKLSEWLDREKASRKLTRSEFAAEIGVTPQAITGYCEGDFEPRKEVMQQIFEKTNGEVTPIDFMLTPKRGQAETA